MIIITYIGSKGKTLAKKFEDMQSAEAFTKKLDERIEKGTCGGYLMTALKKWG